MTLDKMAMDAGRSYCNFVDLDQDLVYIIDFLILKRGQKSKVLSRIWFNTKNLLSV